MAVSGWLRRNFCNASRSWCVRKNARALARNRSKSVPTGVMPVNITGMPGPMVSSKSV